ncbi:MAG: hypothetical protein LBI01_05960 [Elusimicrobium sp.]|nr:hypothetical protein [Elusimicrobium sp.]
MTEAVTSDMSGALFTKTGGGALLLQGNNTFTSFSSINAGSVFLQTRNNLVGDIYLNGGFIAAGNTLSLSNNITVNGGGFDVDYSGAATDEHGVNRHVRKQLFCA